jgi:DNA polymerase elongation subunit (family B)
MNFERQCLPGVLKFGGVVKSFLSRAVHGGIRYAHHGTWEDIAFLDFNSLYPYALTRISPAVGAPLVWENSMDISKFPYYVVEIEISEISFPSQGLLPSLLSKIHKVGERKVEDKTTIEDIQKYSSSFSIIRGYVWENVSDENREKIRKFIAKEYREKREAPDEDTRKMAKLKLNSIYGYTLKRGMRKMNRGKKGTWEIQLRKNAPLIESIDEENHSFFVRNTYDMSFNYTALGVAILSETHRIMYELIHQCDEKGIPIYYIHTDSICVPSNCISPFRSMIGARLGEIKIEYDCKQAEIVNSGKYRLTLTNGKEVSKGKW